MQRRLISYLGTTKDGFVIYLVVTLSTGLYFFNGIKSVLYEPFRDTLGVTDGQLGLLLAIVGFIQIFGYLAFGWLQDLLPIRKIIAFDMLGYGAIALVLALIPNLPFWFLVIAFIGFGLFGDALYWPTIQKATRSVASDEKQAAAFSTQEAIRSGMWLVVHSLSLIIFIVAGSSLFGVRIAMVVYSLYSILFSIVVLRRIPQSFLHGTDTARRSTSNRSAAIRLLRRAVRQPVVWTTGVGAAGGYLVFVGANTYFLPIIQDTFGLTDAQTGLFGVANAGLMAIIAAPISGALASYKFKSSASWMAIVYVGIAVLTVGMILMSRAQALVLPLVGVALLVSLCCYAIRALYYAPVGEYGVDRQISATAMSIASFIGYSPAFFGYLVFGAILDRFEGEEASLWVYTTMAAFAALGAIANWIGAWLIRKNGGRSEVAYVEPAAPSGTGVLPE